nr:immunoglobulin heavy chain junction region [Mus musculus]
CARWEVYYGNYRDPYW